MAVVPPGVVAGVESAEQSDCWPIESSVGRFAWISSRVRLRLVMERPSGEVCVNGRWLLAMVEKGRLLG